MGLVEGFFQAWVCLSFEGLSQMVETRCVEVQGYPVGNSCSGPQKCLDYDPFLKSLSKIESR